MPELPRAINYSVDDKSGRIEVGAAAPFDGKPCLIKLVRGWVQATWWTQEIVTTVDGSEVEGFCWDCLDSSFNADLDEASHWLPLPPEFPL